ncbi:FeoB-associated Cys-rich membrane protein [Flavobacterium chuncheonense]|uniref:FeoB-associated Cys-rich membrane protein n=1 Tax=Flavobacterium chuncheonense TaxID=2026653 RepID=A0ABW5YNX4_9FLAO
MANYSIGFHEWISLHYFINCLSSFKIMIQEILVYITLAVAIGFLVKKFFWKKKPKKGNKSCGDDCGCH